MNDIITLEKNKVSLTSNDVIINVSLHIPEIYNLIKTYGEELGIKYITYITFINSYKSDLVIKGLIGEELLEGARIKANLPVGFIPTEDIKEASNAFKKHYSKGLPGLIKEIYRSFEITRESTELINNISNGLQKALKEQIKGNVDSKSLGATSTIIKDIISNVKYIRDIANSLDEDISKLKALENKLGALEKHKIVVQGDGTLPKTATRGER